jgi:hypothetical protein
VAKQRNIQNLKPFVKGQSGNPKGRPKLPDIREAMAKVLAEEKDGMTALEAILKAMRGKAAKGDVRAADFLISRGYGKADQRIEIDGQMPTTIIQIIPDPKSHPIISQ